MSNENQPLFVNGQIALAWAVNHLVSMVGKDPKAHPSLFLSEALTTIENYELGRDKTSQGLYALMLMAGVISQLMREGDLYRNGVTEFSDAEKEGVVAAYLAHREEIEGTLIRGFRELDFEIVQVMQQNPLGFVRAIRGEQIVEE